MKRKQWRGCISISISISVSSFLQWQYDNGQKQRGSARSFRRIGKAHASARALRHAHGDPNANVRFNLSDLCHDKYGSLFGNLSFDYMIDGEVYTLDYIDVDVCIDLTRKHSNHRTFNVFEDYGKSCGLMLTDGYECSLLLLLLSSKMVLFGRVVFITKGPLICILRDSISLSYLHLYGRASKLLLLFSLIICI